MKIDFLKNFQVKITLVNTNIFLLVFRVLCAKPAWVGATAHTNFYREATLLFSRVYLSYSQIIKNTGRLKCCVQQPACLRY